MPLHKSWDKARHRTFWQSTCSKCSWSSKRYLRQVDANTARTEHLDTVHRSAAWKAARESKAVQDEVRALERASRPPAVFAPEPPAVAPDPDRIGWCHTCGTYQLGRHARRVYMAWSDGFEYACASCDDEPWGLGVWNPPLCRECAAAWLPLAEGLSVGWNGIGCEHREE